MVDQYPKICNLCGGQVDYVSNAVIYGRKYGSGFCYRCRDCGAYVGTHKPWPKKAMGILADGEMREWKKKCHALFDPFWKGNQGSKNRQERRRNLYIRLAGEMGIDPADCHFGYFDLKDLQEAYKLLKNWQKDPPEDMDYEPATYPCRNCYMAAWQDMYGVMVYCCDMSSCRVALEEEAEW